MLKLLYVFLLSAIAFGNGNYLKGDKYQVEDILERFIISTNDCPETDDTQCIPSCINSEKNSSSLLYDVDSFCSFYKYYSDIISEGDILHYVTYKWDDFISKLEFYLDKIKHMQEIWRERFIKGGSFTDLKQCMQNLKKPCILSNLLPVFETFLRDSNNGIYILTKRLTHDISIRKLYKLGSVFTEKIAEYYDFFYKWHEIQLGQVNLDEINYLMWKKEFNLVNNLHNLEVNTVKTNTLITSKNKYNYSTYAKKLDKESYKDDESFQWQTEKSLLHVYNLNDKIAQGLSFIDSFSNFSTFQDSGKLQIDDVLEKCLTAAKEVTFVYTEHSGTIMALYLRRIGMDTEIKIILRNLEDYLDRIDILLENQLLIADNYFETEEMKRRYSLLQLDVQRYKVKLDYIKTCSKNIHHVLIGDSLSVDF